MWQIVKKNITVGIFTLLPLLLIFYILRTLYKIAYNLMTPIGELAHLSEHQQLILTGVVLVIFLLLLLGIGVAMKTTMGTAFLNYIERHIMQKIPGYGVLQEAVEQFSQSKENQSVFSKVVLADPYESNCLMWGFLTDEYDDYKTVYIPVAPNITSGYIYHVKSDYVFEISHIQTGEVIKVLLSCGLGSKKLLESMKGAL